MSVRTLTAVLLAGAFIAAVATLGTAEDRKPPTTTSAPSADVKSFTGEIGRTGSRKLPRLKVGETVYILTAADNAEAGVKDTLASVAKGDVTGTYTVKGTVKSGEGQTIVVVSIAKGEGEKPKETPRK